MSERTPIWIASDIVHYRLGPHDRANELRDAIAWEICYARHERDAARERLLQANWDIAEFQAELDTRNRSDANLPGKLKNAEIQLAGTADVVEKLRQQLAEEMADNARLRDKVVIAETERDTARAQRDEAKKQNLDLDKSLVWRRTERDEFRVERDNARDAAKAYKQHVGELESKYRLVLIERDAGQRRLRLLSERLNSLLDVARKIERDSNADTD